MLMKGDNYNIPPRLYLILYLTDPHTHLSPNLSVLYQVNTKTIWTKYRIIIMPPKIFFPVSLLMVGSEPL